MTEMYCGRGFEAIRQYCGLLWFSTSGPLTIPFDPFRPISAGFNSGQSLRLLIRQRERVLQAFTLAIISEEPGPDKHKCDENTGSEDQIMGADICD